MKNVYFIQANNVYGDTHKTTYIPYAAGCIEAYCLQSAVVRENYRFGKIIYTRLPPQEVLEKLDEPYMVLFSCSVWNMQYNKAIASVVKEHFPHCLIVFGGHSVSADEDDLRENPFVDILIHRFGEEPALGMLESLALGTPLSAVPNLSYRTGEGSFCTTAYAPQTGTDYPSPYLNGIFDDLLQDDITFSVLFETNRGCPNSCAFCDWGSLKSKVRLFPMERVLAEMDWFVRHKIEFVYCTDGNFCLFRRDEEIARYVVQCKEKYGYPKIFRVCFTKNKFDSVFRIGEMFVQSGLDKAQTLSFQSMHPPVLENVGRKNISTQLFRDLMRRYNRQNISTFSELILGLPGETYSTFCDGVCALLENGQHFAINIYPCELLPNAEMGQREYIQRYGLQSTDVPFRLIHSNGHQTADTPTEYSRYVTATDTMHAEDWVKSLLFANYVQALHNLGLLRAVAIFCRYESGVPYVRFYQGILEYSEKTAGTLLNAVFQKVRKLCGGIIRRENALVVPCDGYGDTLWGFDELIYLEFYKDLDRFLEQMQTCVSALFGEREEMQALFVYQRDIIKKIGVSQAEIHSAYDFYHYFQNIFLGNYSALERKAITLRIRDPDPVYSLAQFAQEAVWYGRNRRATDYTSSNYTVEVLCASVGEKS